NDSSPLGSSKRYGSSKERVRDALATMSWSYANAPHRPHVSVVYVRNLSISRESCVSASGYGGPSHRLVPVIREDTDWSLLEEFGDLPATCRSPKCRVLLGRNPIAQAPADVRISALRAH